MIRVDAERFDELIGESFGAPNEGSAKLNTMLNAINTGKIQVCQVFGNPSSRLLVTMSTDDGPQEVRRWLRELPIAPEARVFVFWPAMRCGISTSYRGFVDAHDELWFPSAEDLWVRPASGGWLLELDHEEMLRFFGSMGAR